MVRARGLARRLAAPAGSAVEGPLALGLAALACAFLAVAALLAATLPYSGWDPYAFGAWSRLIGLHGGFHFPTTGPQELHRPLFYVLQGGVWRVFGYHMALGRLLSLAFTIALLAALARLAARPDHRALRASVVVLLALVVPDLAVHASDGLTDVPAAATIAATAVVLWTVRDGRARPFLLGAAALLAVLAKPSGLVGVGGLLLAQLVGERRTFRRRLERDVVPLAAGLLAGVGYDWSQAHYLHMSLKPFLQAGVGSGIWEQRAAASHAEAIYGWRWLGEPLHVLLVFTVAYALLRGGGLRHRTAAAIGVPVAWLWAWLGPRIADHPFAPGTDSKGIATWVLAASLVLVVAAPEESAPDRVWLVRMLIWALPALVLWTRYGAYDTRLASGAWPPLMLLVGTVGTLAILGGATRSPVLALVPAAAAACLLFNAVYDLNGLGREGWRQYDSRGIRGLGDAALMENVALGAFQQELDAIRGAVGPDGRVIGGDGRLAFFFPGRVAYDYPRSCSELRGYRVFVLLHSDESVAAAREAGAPATESEWAACRSPRATLVASDPSIYSIFSIS